MFNSANINMGLVYSSVFLSNTDTNESSLQGFLSAFLIFYPRHNFYSEKNYIYLYKQKEIQFYKYVHYVQTYSRHLTLWATFTNCLQQRKSTQSGFPKYTQWKVWTQLLCFCSGFLFRLQNLRGPRILKELCDVVY